MASHDGALDTVPLRDGRTLEYAAGGAAQGPVVVFHHGTPGSAFRSPPLFAAAAARGLRVVSASRSGYGGSGRDDGRDVAAVAADTAALLDRVGAERFATVGWSGGGPHALACAALLPDRCAAALSVAGVAPHLPDEFDWTDGMGPDNVQEFGLALAAGPAYDEMLAAHREAFLALREADVRSARQLFGDLVSDVDEASTTPERVAFLLANVAHGLAPGVGGWRDDDQAFLREWGVDVRAIPTPTGVWFGDQDLMVPTRHGEWLAANVRGTRMTRLPGEGHISISLGRFDAMLDELLDLAGGTW
ncbi:MAG TPA: alpha/beta hydrolase [Acidimicrobiales bacterium]|jgi:pimeloyl-ACP methyl ester carboxylesterase|nr:alpha/beta hydrolase [Acidimicrobiales bacterium]